MVLRRHRLHVGEFNHELVWLALSTGLFAAAGIWLTVGLPWPECVFLAVTGLPCATCGATRCAIQLFHGDFPGAWGWNPLMFLSLCAIALYDVYAFSVVVLRVPRIRISNFTSFEKNLIRITLVGLILLNWAYLLVFVRG